MANVYDELRKQENIPIKKKPIKISKKPEKKKPFETKTTEDVEVSETPVEEARPVDDYEKRIEKRNKKREKGKRTPLQAMKDMSTKQKRKLIIFAVLISYGIFLLYGLANSEFVINEDGITMPIAKTQEEVKEIKEYNLIKSYYTDAQNKYKEILNTDIDLAKNTGSQKVVATRYEGYLGFFDNYITQLRGVEISEKYVYVKEGLLSWATNDITRYLTNIGDGIAQNNQNSKAMALEDRVRSINTFNTVTENMVSIAESIRGADMTGLDFNPEVYYEEKGAEK